MPSQKHPDEITFSESSRCHHIGTGHPVFLVAEMSGNHNYSLERAKALIAVAADAGVNAVKIQTYTPDTLTIDCDLECFQVRVNPQWKGETLYSLYQKAHTPWEWQPSLMEFAKQCGVLLFSTPFDESAVDFLEGLKVPLYKIASFESMHIPLLRRVGQTKKPVILSRGLTTESDLKLAIETLKQSGCPQLAVLHCVSSYPANPSQMNLKTIPTLAQRFNVTVGLSDHTLGIESSIAAVALGATIIEKHFTLKRSDGGPDAAFSLEAEELKAWVTAIRNTELALGESTFEFDERQKENIIFKRSIFVIQSLKRGERLSLENVRIIRPGHGLSPRHFDSVIGRCAKVDIIRGTPLDWDLIE